LFLLLQLLRLQVDRLRQGEDKDELVKQLKDDHNKEVQKHKGNYKDLKKLTRCGICRKAPLKVALKGCGHVFCRACLESWFKARNHRCPACKCSGGETDMLDLYLGF
jgi:E3 ubiquitin-protein ligase BRE1